MRLIFLLLLGLVLCAVSQPLTTSDSRQINPQLPYPPGMSNAEPWPQRFRIYVAPRIDVFPLVLTNVRPLVWEETITTQVVQRTVWHRNGSLQTNDTVLSSNLLSRTTNFVNRD